MRMEPPCGEGDSLSTAPAACLAVVAVQPREGGRRGGPARRLYSLKLPVQRLICSKTRGACLAVHWALCGAARGGRAGQGWAGPPRCQQADRLAGRPARQVVVGK